MTTDNHGLTSPTRSDPSVDSRRVASRTALSPSAVVVAAHGGCGATTLAQHLTLVARVRERRIDDVLENTGSYTATCLLVASSTADGTARAVRALHRLELAGINSDRLHLVFVRDGRGPLPVAARARLRLLAPVVAGIHAVPHVQRWRYEAGESRTRSRRYDRAVNDLADRVTQQFAHNGQLDAATAYFLEEDL